MKFNFYINKGYNKIHFYFYSQKKKILKKLAQFRDFNFKVNWGSRIFVQNPSQSVNYKIYIGRGNNRSLIQRYFKAR